MIFDFPLYIGMFKGFKKGISINLMRFLEMRRYQDYKVD